MLCVSGREPPTAALGPASPHLTRVKVDTGRGD